MSREKLNAAAQYFMGHILPIAINKSLRDLNAPQNHLEILLGAYQRYSGPELTSFGQPITPEFVLKVRPGPIAVSDNSFNLGTDAVAADALDHCLLWMRYVADAKVDDQATIQDLMGDLDTYVEQRFSLAGVDVSIPGEIAKPANSTLWAQAIQSNRTAVPDNIADLTEVPTAFKGLASAPSAVSLILSHFFTYDDKGAYYARWSGAGRRIPEDLSDIYKQNNLREVKLMRNQMYVYMLAPKSLFTTAAAETHDYREAVIRLDKTGNPLTPFSPTLVHCAYRQVETTSAIHDFIFFESEDGLGLPISNEVRAKLSPALEQFLVTIPSDAQARAQYFDETTSVISGTPPLVNLTATTQGPLTLPHGVLASSGNSGRIVSMLAPIDKVLDIAALSPLKYLELAGRPHKPALNLVRGAIDFDTFRTKYAADKQDGAGVIVGIIDSGIDGRHPAFNDASGKSRILAVWEQDQGDHGNPNSPAKKHPGVAAYATLDYGRELTGANVSTATDDPSEGHGTHVAGIAAGAEVTGTAGNVPRGIASAAKIIVVKAIGVRQGDPVAGLRYIFQKASELKMPCVVNMSFGTQDDPHDGTDDMARDLTDQLHDSNGKYLPGRILVAAAGNERTHPIHDQRDLVAKGSANFLYRLNVRAPGGGARKDTVTIWVRPKDKAAPKPNLRVAARHVLTGWTSAAVTPTAHGIPVPVPGSNIMLGILYGDRDPHNGDYNVKVSFTSTATSGAPLPKEQWLIIVTNDSTVDLEMHAWSATPPSLGGFDDVTPAEMASFKVGSPASAYDVITVAATCTRSAWTDIDGAAESTAQDVGDLANFSSPGPLRTCSDLLFDLFFLTLNLTRPAIDIAAPGCLTQSALAANVPITVTATMPPNDPVRYNRRMTINSNSWLMQGTSMAAPVITGLIACLLSAKPQLTQEDIRSRMNAAGKLPAKTKFDTGHPDPNAWGPGLVIAPTLMKP